MQQNVTNLSHEQQQAIDLLICGKSLGCIAEELNIRRETLWRWRQLPAFQQAHQQMQEHRREETRELAGDILRLTLLALHKEVTEMEDSSWHRFDKSLAVLKLFHGGPLVVEQAPAPAPMVTL